jgi:protein ImuA
MLMSESPTSLAALRRTIAALDRKAPEQTADRFATGHPGLDAALGGGLARGRLHELFADSEEAGAGTGMALLLARLAAGPGRTGTGSKPLLWLRTEGSARMDGTPYGPGLAAIGIAPDRLLLGVMADMVALLQAALDGLRCPGLGAVVVEARGRQPLIDLTATRRLALAAEGSGVTALLARIGGDPAPSAAETRWRVAAAPSAPLPGDAPGHSAFDLHLLRRRAGPDGLSWRVEWRAHAGAFGEWNGGSERQGRETGRDGAALSGAVVPVPAPRPAADRAA